MFLCCRWIHFTQRRVSSHFRDGSPLHELMRQLVVDPDIVQSVEPLRIFRYRRKWFSLDNRRLACYITASTFLCRDILVPVVVLSERRVSGLCRCPIQYGKVRFAKKGSVRRRSYTHRVKLRRLIRFCGCRIKCIRRRRFQCVHRLHRFGVCGSY